MKTYIYTLSDNSGIRYVGKSNNPEGRLRKHLKECKMKRTHKEKWIFSLKESGKIPILEVLDEIDHSEWSFYESYWISQLKSWGFNLLNGTSGGEGSDGFRGKSHSEETKEKLRRKSIGRKGIPMYGGRNGRAILNEEIVKEIKILLRDTDLTHKEISSRFDKVSKTNVTMISTNKRWSHVKI